MNFTFQFSSVRLIRLSAIAFFLIGSSMWSQAQSDSTSLARYFDDDGISNGVMIKTDIVSVIHGDLPFLIETKLKNSLVLEAGPGLLLPYYVHDFLALAFTDNKGINNNSFGYSARIHLKWYARKADRDYWGMQFYHRAFDTITVNEWTFTMGDQRIVGKRLVLDIALGLGVRFQKSQGTEYMFDPDFSMMPIVPLIVRFGYVTGNR